MKLVKGQMGRVAANQILEKLDRFFVRDIAEFGELDKPDRYEFLSAGLLAAAEVGLVTEQGIAAYVLASWWLGDRFEDQSRHLKALLATGIAEVRKIYAMNAWVHALIGKPDDVATADEKLKQAFFRTRSWALQ